MTEQTIFSLRSLVNEIVGELGRLDAVDSQSNCYGICVYADDDLPRGWVRLADGSGEEVFGEAAAVLAALREVEYDPEAQVEQESEPDLCLDPACYGGRVPDDAADLHCHSCTELVPRDNGWELAWEALAQFEDHAPASGRDWPDGLWQTEQLEEGGPSDEPCTLIRVETNAGTRWCAGPHGVDTCALEEAIRYGGLRRTREEALADLPYEEEEEGIEE